MLNIKKSLEHSNNDDHDQWRILNKKLYLINIINQCNTFQHIFLNVNHI